MEKNRVLNQSLTQISLFDALGTEALVCAREEALALRSTGSSSLSMTRSRPIQ